MLIWIQNNQALLWSFGGISVLVFIGSLLLMPMLVARIPVDYFAHDTRPRSWIADTHPVVRAVIHIFKNALGALLLVMGVVMLFMPGQGLLTMFAGLVLLDLPGKYRFEKWLVARRSVLRSLNWIRRRAKREPLEAPAVSNA